MKPEDNLCSQLDSFVTLIDDVLPTADPDQRGSLVELRAYCGRLRSEIVSAPSPRHEGYVVMMRTAVTEVCAGAPWPVVGY